MPSLKIEVYQQRIGNEFWLAEGIQMKTPSKQWAQDKKTWKSLLAVRRNEVKTRVGCVIRRRKEQLGPGRIAVRTDPVMNHVSEQQEKTWKIIHGLCLTSLSLSLAHPLSSYVVSLCPANAVDSVFIPYFFLPNDYLKSVVANKLFC